MRLVLSPHLDDAVLSASSALYAGTHVVTVFAGMPPEPATPGAWDRLTRAGSATTRVLERRAEDAAAMSLFPVTFEDWDLVDGQHRTHPADVAAIAARIRPLLAAGVELWAPAGVQHPDHAAVSDAAISAARTARLAWLTLYADVPHAIPYGWPQSVSGDPDPPHLDRDAWLDTQLSLRGFDTARLQRRVIPLRGQRLSTKRRAVRCYATQLAALGMEDGDSALLTYELTWVLKL